jgi:6-phosphogluconate dehydrogenase (decarboxylating)
MKKLLDTSYSDSNTRVETGLGVQAVGSFERLSSRGDADFQDKLLSAMRFEFGGHLEKSAK